MTCNECNPCTEGDTACNCPQKDMSTDCTVYTGDDLECSGISKNTVLTKVIQDLDAFICNKFQEAIQYLTLINIGTGAKVYKGISGIGNKEIRTITKTGDLIVITENADDINVTIDETALDTFIEANQLTYSADNVGLGAEVYKDNTVVGDNIQFNFKTITKTGDLIDVTNNADDVNIAINEAALNTFVEDNQKTYSIAEVGTGAGVYKDSTIVGDNTQFNLRTLKSDTLVITENVDDITIESNLIELTDFIVDTRFAAETYDEKGTYAKPYKNLDNAIVAYIGSGTRLAPEFGGSRILCIGGQSHNFTEDLSINNLVLEVEEGTTIRYTGLNLYLIDFRTLQTSAGGYGTQSTSLSINIRGGGRIITESLFSYAVNSGHPPTGVRVSNRLLVSDCIIQSLYKSDEFVSNITRSDLTPWLSGPREVVFYFGDVDEPCVVVEGQNDVADNANATASEFNSVRITSISQQVVLVDSARLLMNNTLLSHTYTDGTNAFIIADDTALVGTVLTESPLLSYTLPNHKDDLCLLKLNGNARVEIQGGGLTHNNDITLSEAWYKIINDTAILTISNANNTIIVGGLNASNFIETEIFHPTITITNTEINKTLSTGATFINTTIDPFTKATVNGNKFTFRITSNIDLTRANTISVVNTFAGKIKESLQKFASRVLAVAGGLTSGDIFVNRKTVTAGSFVVGLEYSILTIGTTDYTLVGAASNTVGLNFTATGMGSGSGTAYFHTRDIIL